MRKYALLFIGLHFVVAASLGVLLSQLRIRVPGLGTTILYCAAIVTGLIFARRRKRLYTNPEMWRIISLCFLYVMAFEVVGAWGAGKEHPEFKPGWLIGFWLFGSAMRLLSLWLAFRFVVPWTMRRELERMDKAAMASPGVE